MGTVYHPVRLDSSDRRRLSRALGSSQNTRTYRRVHSLWLLAKRYDIKTVTGLCRCSRRAVYNWLHRYAQRHHVQALQEAPRSGRPRQAPTVTRGRILRELKHKPWLLGYSTTVWTVALLARQLSQRYGCRITPWTLRRRMHQSGLRWKRPRHIYCRQEPHVAQKKGRYHQVLAAFASPGCTPGSR